MKISGSLSKDTIPEVRKELEENLELIRQQFMTLGNKIPYLVDLSDFTGTYDPEALTLFGEFARGTRDMVAKAAIYGANMSTELIVQMVAIISGRDDIEVFPTREEALAALNITGTTA